MNAEVARALNEQIVRVAQVLPPAVDHKYAFRCEDGCDAVVSLTVTEYQDAGGAWLDDHKPPAPAQKRPTPLGI